MEPPGSSDIDALRRAAQDKEARSTATSAESGLLEALRRSPDCALVTLNDRGTIVDWSAGAEQIYGYSAVEALGHDISLLGDSGRAAEGSTVVRRRKDGTLIRVSVTSHSSGQRIAEFSTTSTKPAAGIWSADRDRVLQMIATRAAGPAVLEAICGAVEHQIKGAKCAIVVLAASGSLDVIAAPSLPAWFIDSFRSGVSIHDTSTPCALAAQRGETAIVSDITSDGSPSEWKSLALRAGYRACWSQPMLGENGRVVGTVDTYHEGPRSPTTDESDALLGWQALASLALRNLQNYEDVRSTQERLILAQEFAPFDIWEWDLIGDEVIGSREMFQFLDADVLERAKKQACETGQPLSVEFRATRADGGERWIRTTGKVIRDDSGRPVRLLGVNVDITVQMKAEAALRESEALAHALPAMIAYIDLDGRPHFGNRTYELWLGLAHDELAGRTLEEVLGPENYKLVEKPVERVLAGEPQKFEFEFRTRDGSMKDLRATFVPHADEDAAIPGFFAIIEDITEAKSVQRSLRESESRFRHFAEHAPVMVWVTEPDGYCSYVSRSWHEFTGQSDDEALGSGWLNATHPDSREEVRHIFESANSRREPFRVEYRLRRHDGTYRWVIDAASPRISPEGVFLGYIGSVMDITERRETEEALEARESEYRTLVEALPDVIWRLGADLRFRYASPSVEKLMGQAPSHYIGRSYRETGLPLELSEFLSARVEPLFQTGRQDMIEFRVESPGGGHRYLVCIAVPEKDASGQVSSVLCIVRDVSEAVMAEQAVRSSEFRFRQLANAVPAFVWTAEPTGAISFFNDRWFDYTGLTAEQSLEYAWAQAVHVEDVARLNESWSRALANGTYYEAQLRWRKSDGTYRWFISRALPVRDGSGAILHWFGTSIDIHETKLAEDALVKANRALEEFAYVASHDLQEPLRMVNIYTEQLVRRHVPENPDAKECASYIQHGAHRMHQLIRDLLVFSRTVHSDHALDTDVADLNASLRKAWSLFQARALEEGVVLTAGVLPKIQGDEGQMAHVFQNLISNSLKYRSDERPLVINISVRESSDAWIITVQDNGIGFEQQYSSRIFGLFKRLHKDAYPGTGLGLAICKRVIERHGGRIWAEGKRGEGAAFHFSLPKMEAGSEQD